MQVLKRAMLFALILLIAAIVADAQSQSQEAKEPTASITGRITIGNKPAQGIVVMALPEADKPPSPPLDWYKLKTFLKTTTDGEGIYRFTNMAQGEYVVRPFAPALTGSSEPNWRLEKEVKLAEGEAVEKIDFSLIRGGVITGRVTDVRGRPVIGQTIMIAFEDPEYPAGRISERLSLWSLLMGMSQTDDRGMYRIYGLPAGRYVVSFKESVEFNRIFFSPRFTYAKGKVEKETFHPGVTSRDKASAVEVKEGHETTGVDIRLGPPTRTYKASGRVIDAETGKPVSSAIANYRALPKDGTNSYIPTPTRAVNSKGEFQLDSLLPGKYSAYATFNDDSEFYTESTPFEIGDGNLTGLTVKVHRGQIVSGAVVIEGPMSAEAQASLSQLPLIMSNTGSGTTESQIQRVKFASDGSFRLTGIQPGKLSFRLLGFEESKFTLLRTERNGVRLENSVQIVSGENIADLRLMVAFTNGVIRGQLKSASGAPLKKEELLVAAYRIGDENFNHSARTGIDDGGEFKFENLLPGEYELSVHSLASHPVDQSKRAPKLSEYPVLSRQRITVANDAETTVTITVDASNKQ